MKKNDTKYILERLANLKIDVKKQSFQGKVNLSEKQKLFLIQTLSDNRTLPEKNSDYIIKSTIAQLKTSAENFETSKNELLHGISLIDSYFVDHVDSNNAKVKELLSDMKTLREVFIEKLYSIMIVEMRKFLKRMDYFITLREKNNTEFDEKTLNTSLYTMHSNYEYFSEIYHLYFSKEEEFSSLLQIINEKMDRVEKTTSFQK